MSDLTKVLCECRGLMSHGVMCGHIVVGGGECKAPTSIAAKCGYAKKDLEMSDMIGGKENDKLFARRNNKSKEEEILQLNKQVQEIKNNYGDIHDTYGKHEDAYLKAYRAGVNDTLDEIGRAMAKLRRP